MKATYAYPRFDERDDQFATYRNRDRSTGAIGDLEYRAFPEPVVVFPCDDEVTDAGLMPVSFKGETNILFVQTIDFETCQAESIEEATGIMLQEYGLVRLFDMYGEPIEQVGDVYELDTEDSQITKLN